MIKDVEGQICLSLYILLNIFFGGCYIVKELVNALYKKVELALSNKSNLTSLQYDLDKYMAKNIDIYSAIGPYKRPIFSDKNINDLITTVGLTIPEIKTALKECKYIKPSWVEVNKPFNIAIVLVIRYFLIKGDAKNLDIAMSYFVVSMYPIMHYRYFRYIPNEAALTYTMNNLSNKFNIKQDKSMWVTLMNMIKVCTDHFKKQIIEGTDKAIADYIESFKTRLNSFLKKIRGEFEEVYQKKLYLGNEFESFDDDNYHEAASDITAINNITNKVVSSLVVHGPDMRVITLSANRCKVSVNLLRSYLIELITNEHRDDIEKMTESLIYLYLNSEESESHIISGIGSNDFFIHSMKIYKKSNTIDEHVVKIKEILDKWLVTLKITETRPRAASDFRKAMYMFFVLSIIKLN